MRMRRWLAVALCALAAPAAAQRLELTPTISYGTSASLDHTAPGVSGLAVDDGIVWGGQARYFLTPHVGIGGLWSYESSGLRMPAGSGSTDLFRMTTNQVHAHVVYEFRDAT